MNNSSQSSQAKLDNAINDLNSDIAPSRDLWPGIEKAISQQPREQVKSNHYSWRSNLALAASVVALVITLVNVNGLPNPSNQTDVVAMMVESFENERQAMLVSFGNTPVSKNALSADLQKQLDELIKARKSIISALEEDPENADLIHLLKFTQQQELSLLNHIYRPKWQTI